VRVVHGGQARGMSKNARASARQAAGIIASGGGPLNGVDHPEVGQFARDT